jgi:hypothetical protein
MEVYMKFFRLTVLLSLLFFVLSVAPLWADPEKAINAYKNKDYKTAFAEFKKDAEKGDAKAQYNLAVMYRDGLGVQKNRAETMKWYQKAADQGHSLAQYNLGVSYDNGFGVPKNKTEAAKWYKKSATKAIPMHKQTMPGCMIMATGFQKIKLKQ